MKTMKKRVRVYIDMCPADSTDSMVFGCACVWDSGSIPSLMSGYLRNRVEVEVTVPIREEMVELPPAVAEIEVTP